MSNLIKEMTDIDHGAVFPHQNLEKKLQPIENCVCFNLNLHNLNPLNQIKLAKICKQFKPDLLHSHGKAAGLWGRMLSMQTKVPIIHQFHGLHWRHYPFALQGAYFVYEKIFAHMTDGFVFVSNGEMDEYDQWIDAKTLGKVIPNGVSASEGIDQAEREKLQHRLDLPEDIPILVSITRAVYQKSLDRLLYIHGQLLKIRPSVLLLIGVHPEDLEKHSIHSEQKRLIRCIHDEQNVISKIQLGEIYLSTSRWEGFSLGLLEALGAGVPAIVSAVTGHLDLIPLHPKGLRLVGTNNSDEYLQHIIEWLDDTKKRKEAGMIAQKYVNKLFSLRESAQSMQSYYNEVLENVYANPKG